MSEICETLLIDQSMRFQFLKERFDFVGDISILIKAWRSETERMMIRVLWGGHAHRLSPESILKRRINQGRHKSVV